MQRKVIHLQTTTPKLTRLWPPQQSLPPLSTDTRTYSTTLRAARKMFTPRRLEILEAPCALPAPTDVRTIAKAVKRGHANAHRDPRLLAKHGVVSMRRVLIPGFRGPMPSFVHARVTDLALRFVA